MLLHFIAACRKRLKICFAFHLAMANIKSHTERCADLKRWCLEHDGIRPKQKSSDNEEAGLANWLSRALPRRTRASGSKPSQSLLDAEEIALLNDAMGCGETPHGLDVAGA